MASTKEVIQNEIKTLHKNINYLNKKLDTLTWKYVQIGAQDIDYINKVFLKLQEYLIKYHNVIEADAVEILQTIRDGLTMGPISNNVSRHSKYDTYVSYDTILYEWKGHKIIYVRADRNSDNYYKEYDDYNGMSIDELELEKSQAFNWWKTEYKVSEWKTMDLLEKLIKNSYPYMENTTYNPYYSTDIPKPASVISNILDDLKILPPELHLIRILFDMKCNFHYLLHDEGSIYNVYQLIPNISSYNYYEDEDED